MADASYASLLQSLQSCSERLKKSKRNLAKVIPQVTQELDQLLFSVRQQTMNDSCPSSRVYEAQVLMNKAVVKRHAGHHLEEAQCYVSADSIWVAIERERRGVNYPTTDDALARSVLCSAMACNVLLHNKYPAGQNPIPLRLMGHAADHIMSDPGTYNTNLLWCPHLSRAWAVCYRLANVLTDFNCTEMAADYYELAAIIVSVDMYGNDEGGDAHKYQRNPHGAANNNNITATAATAPSSSIASPASAAVAVVTTHVDPLSNDGPTPTPSAASSPSAGANAAAGNNATQPIRSTNLAPHSSSLSAAGGAPHHHGHHHRSHGAASTAAFSSTSSRDHTNVSMYGRRAGNGTPTTTTGSGASSPAGNYRNSVRGTSSGKGTKAAGTIGIAPGFLYHYVLALLSCAKACVLIKDYPRALSVVDELVGYCDYVQTELAACIKGQVWRGGGGGGGAAGGISNTANAAVIADQVKQLSQLLGQTDAVAAAPATSAADGTVAAPAAADGEATKEPSASATDPTAAINNNNSTTPSTHSVNVSFAAPSSTITATNTNNNPHQHNAPYSTDPSHHMFTLLELGSALTEVRVIKFCIATILAEPDATAVAYEQIRALRRLSDVWQTHSDTTARQGLVEARNGSTIKGLLFGGRKKVVAEKGSAASITTTAATTNVPAEVNDTARNLQRLATTMEMIVEESGWATSTAHTSNGNGAASITAGEGTTAVTGSPTKANTTHPSFTTAACTATTTLTPTRELLSRRVLEACERDMVAIMSAMGIRARDVTVLVHRMHTSLVTNTLVSATPLIATALEKGARTEGLRKSMAAVAPQQSYGGGVGNSSPASTTTTTSSPAATTASNDGPQQPDQTPTSTVTSPADDKQNSADTPTTGDAVTTAASETPTTTEA